MAALIAIEYKLIDFSTEEHKGSLWVITCHNVVEGASLVAQW